MISSARATRGLTYKKVEAQVELHSFRLSVFSPLNLNLALTFRWDARSGNPPGPPRLARLARPARRACSSGLSGFSSFFGSPVGFAGPANKTNQIDQINQFTSPLSRTSRVKETMVADAASFSHPVV